MTIGMANILVGMTMVRKSQKKITKTVCVLVGTVLNNNRGQKHVRAKSIRYGGVVSFVPL